ncbi:hypothetical protein PHMEG_0007049 [Phytophthora megakarya]|uniref:Integrase catalytic domain-containing protein n=1 Tax=Phytophthora megakarya TaxID=4795 RepID=A0A225WMB2_9STRA|nr:hypothetical protein PHMEG_0007049 [Phytophthora megakarya]
MVMALDLVRGEAILVVVVAKAAVEIKGKVSLDTLMLAEPDAINYSDAWSIANGGTLKVTKRGTVALHSVVDGCESQVDLRNVFYCKDVTNNIISYGLLEEKAGVRRQVSEANNQASNGKAERMPRTILNMARDMLFASGLPLKFWGYAVEYAAYVLNRSSCSANAKRMSPIEVTMGKCPDMAGIVTFGSRCTVYRDPGKKSWQPRGEVGMIVGKNDETKGFKVYIPKDMIVVTTQHIKNMETLRKKAAKMKVKPHKKRNKDRPSAGSDDGDHGGGRGLEGAAESLNAAKASSLSTKRMRTRHMGKKHVNVGAVNAVTTTDPKNYHEAKRDEHARIEAMQVEIEALENNNTWEVVVKPRDCKLLHTKWVYKGTPSASTRLRHTPMAQLSGARADLWHVERASLRCRLHGYILCCVGHDNREGYIRACAHLGCAGSAR